MKNRCRIILFVFAAGLYLLSLSNSFTWDDELVIVSNTSLQDFSKFPGIFSSDYFMISRELSYRPVLTILYFFQYQFFKLWAPGYHLFSLLAHAANGVLVFEFLVLISVPLFSAFAASILFIAHPIQTEVVCSIANQEDVFFALLYLSSLLFFGRYIQGSRTRFLAYSLGLYILSLFTKEMAVTLPVILLLLEYFYRTDISQPKRKAFAFKTHLPFWLMTCVFFLLRFYFFRHPDESQLAGNLVPGYPRNCRICS